MKKENIVVGQEYQIKSMESFADFLNKKGIRLTSGYNDDFIKFISEKKEKRVVKVISIDLYDDIYGNIVWIDFTYKEEKKTQCVPAEMLKKLTK